MAPVLEAKQLAKTYETGGAKVLGLRGVDVSIERGEFVAVMGPSGCGKSTLAQSARRARSTDGGRSLARWQADRQVERD